MTAKLELVSFRDASGNCLIEEFLSAYTGHKGDKRLADLVSLIKNVAEKGGLLPPYTKSLSPEWAFLEVRKKESNTLVRVHYLMHWGKMVLLNAFRKPESYKPGGREDREVQRMQKEAEQLRQTFMQDPRLCKEFPPQ